MPLPDERMDPVWVDDGSLWLSGRLDDLWGDHDARELAERVAAHPTTVGGYESWRPPCVA